MKRGFPRARVFPGPSALDFSSGNTIRIVTNLRAMTTAGRRVRHLAQSKGDFPGETSSAVCERARPVAGDRLHTLVMTDGPRPIAIYDGTTCQEILPPQLATAGDIFTSIFINGLINSVDLKSAAAEACRLTCAWLRRKNDI
jgi:hypothetical protein